MKRKIIEIDETKCTGCGLCVNACHESAIELINNKAKLVKDVYCDGLGDCLPHCPSDAIKIVIKEVEAYSEVKVEERKLDLGIKEKVRLENHLNQWPCQIKLVPVTASFFDKAHLLIASTCSAFAYSNFHEDFMQKRITLVGCPKLDEVDYSIKLGDIFKYNDIKSITLVRMEVPCCRGLEIAIQKALEYANKVIPVSVRVLSINGEIKECY